MGLGIDYNKNCRLASGTYVQVHEEGDSTLRPMGNAQGGHYFLGLHSGKRINRYSWTE